MTTQTKTEVPVKVTKATGKMPPRVPEPAVHEEDVSLDKELAHEDIQQGADQSIQKQEWLKRAIQRHPRRDLPRVENIEAPETPPRI